MNFGVITLFPEMFSSLLQCGVLSKAINSNIVSLHLWNLRDFTEDKHQTVDDRPYGGEAGMVLKPDPLSAAIVAAKHKLHNPLVVYLSPQGSVFKQSKVASFLHYDSILLICGRYEGVDERVIKKYVDLQLSVGDYVLSGGELPAMVVIDAVSRAIPGVLGKSKSYINDSLATGLLKGPVYTRPRVFSGLGVPEVLLSGNHQDIKRWRRQKSLESTLLNRPDLLEQQDLSQSDKILLNQIKNK